MDVGGTFVFLRQPLLETIGIAAGALPIAILVGASAALAIVRGGPLGGFVRAGASFVRAVPELVLAIVFVVALGFGAVPGTLALGISGAATVAKLYADFCNRCVTSPKKRYARRARPRAQVFWSASCPRPGPVSSVSAPMRSKASCALP